LDTSWYRAASLLGASDRITTAKKVKVCDVLKVEGGVLEDEVRE
jgi:hypothetical protein